MSLTEARSIANQRAEHAELGALLVVALPPPTISAAPVEKILMLDLVPYLFVVKAQAGTKIAVPTTRAGVDGNPWRTNARDPGFARAFARAAERDLRRRYGL